MFLNSVHEQCPNSDPKQYTVTKLGWVHSAHTQNPGRAHTARAVPMSWALLRAQPAQVAPMLGVHLSRHAQAACPRPGRDIVPGRDLLEASLMSRHHSGQSRPRPPGGVAAPLLCPHRCPCSDLAMMSRHQACSATATHVATSNSCRDVASS